MLVITLTSVPPSLQGELSKYCQQLQTNVYVSDVGARIRESLWQKITENIGNGQATMCWSTNNELGYNYLTTRDNYEVIDYDGIPLMVKLKNSDAHKIKHGFSDAAHYHQAHIHSYSKPKIINKDTVNQITSLPVVSIDLETTGLNDSVDKIISIGACRFINNKIDTFYTVVNVDCEIPDSIKKLTGIQNTDDGIPIEQAINRLLLFIGGDTIVGYNVMFDIGFINAALKELDKPQLANKHTDVEKIVKKKNPLLSNYHLATVCAEYKITSQQFHNSLDDARVTLELYKLLKYS